MEVIRVLAIYLMIGFLLAAVDILVDSQKSADGMTKLESMGINRFVGVTLVAVLWPLLVVVWLLSKLSGKELRK